MSTALAQAALTIALKNNGIEEMPRGSNGGPDVDVYLRSVGLGTGYAWCMAFVFYCVNKAAKQCNATNPLVKTGGVIEQWNRCTLRHLTNRDAAVLKPGDIFIMEFGGGTGHTGFVLKVEGQVVYTIEGNTNEDGSREGYEVAKRVRPLSSFKGFLQLN